MVGKPDHERTFALPLQIEHWMLKLQGIDSGCPSPSGEGVAPSHHYARCVTQNA
jgi:hypothetical protein